MEEETMDLKGFSVSKERDRTQQVDLCRKEYSEHSSNPYILWFYLEPLSASAIKQLSQAHHMMKALHRILISPNATEEESGGILYSVPGIRGKPAMLGQGPSVCWPNVLSLDVTSLNIHPSLFFNLPGPLSISHATHPTCRFPVLVQASSIFSVSLTS